jgi:hypothetical protein
VHHQSSKDDTITSSENPLFPLDRERAEYGDTHTSTVSPSGSAVKHTDTAVIPALADAIPPRETTGTPTVRRTRIAHRRRSRRTREQEVAVMSSNGTKTTSPTRTSMTTKLTRLAVGVGAGLALTLMAMPASADTKPEPGPGPVVQTTEDSGLDTTSIALGALGGIAFAGTGLGIILGVQRRRDHTAPHPA